MSDGRLALEPLVGRWDEAARLFVVTGWTYGPAGPARVTIAPGLTFAVDFANPTVTSEITIEAPLSGDPWALDPVVARAAASLLGSRALDRLLELGRGGGPGHAVRIADDVWRPPADVARQAGMARFVVLAELATDPDVADVPAAVAGLEAAATAPTADPDLRVLRAPAAALASDAAEILLGAAGRGSFDLADGRAADELASVVQGALAVVDDALLVRRLHQFRDDLRHRSSWSQPPAAASLAAPGAPTAQAAASAPAGRTPTRRSRAVRAAARPLRPERLAVDGPPGSVAELTAPTEIQVSSPEHLENGWARVFRRHDRLLLALAPLRPRRGRQAALLVVPTGLRTADLVVDITDEPEAPRPSDPLIQLRAAVRAGRDACRYERAGDERMAAQRWAASAELWAAAGDAERADTAIRYSTGDRSDPRARSGPGNAGRRGPMPPAPFLADRLDRLDRQ